MARLQPVRGTHDILPEEMRRHRRVADCAREVAALYGYAEMATPIFEFTEVFKRTLGETSDIVMKEMYTFSDISGDLITLRPENTAGVCRAIIAGGLTQNLPQKYFYYGPMFRHERPQKGRQRQFHQIGIELIGVAEPLGDVEVIATGARILDRLGVLAKTVLEINTLGDAQDRVAYKQALRDYFSRVVDQLSEDSRQRLDRNVLRILDSKDERDRRFVAEAPLFSKSLSQESRDRFAWILQALDNIGIRYHVNERLVRGLDYYTHTAFEFVTDALGAQGAVMAGGRYDGLIGDMGGPATPGIGWAAGVERLAMLIGEPPPPARPVAVIPIGADAEATRLTLDHGLALAESLRHKGFPVELGYRGRVDKRLKAANRVQARAALLFGTDEVARGVVQLKDLDSGEQAEVPLAALEDRLARFR